MAYVSQEMKRNLSVEVKRILKKYRIKASLSVNHHSTLVLTVKSGPIDFIGNTNTVCGRDHYQVSRGFRPVEDYMDVNPYHFRSHFDGDALAFLEEMTNAMYGPDYYDHSDLQSDYFACSHYINIRIGKWNRPYVVESAVQ